MAQNKNTKKDALPIIFIHKGDSFYLKYALNNAKKYNPKSRIILLGSNITEYPDFVEYYDIKNYSNFAKKFIQKYIHLSTNKEEIERFCFERWFYLYEFLYKNKINQCLTLDSDVLLFENITKDNLKNFKKYDFTLAHNTSGGMMFINNITALKDFCNFTLDLYSNKKTIEKMKKRFKTTKIGGISDMYALGEFYKLKKYKIQNIETIVDNAMYDAGINYSDGCIIHKGIKKIIFIKKIPFCILEKNKKKIRLKSLHLQGPNKFYMKYFAEGKYNFFIEINVRLKKWFRDFLSPKVSKKQILFFKKLMNILGF